MTTPSQHTPCTQNYVSAKAREWSGLGVPAPKIRTQLIEQGCTQVLVDSFVPVPRATGATKQKAKANPPAKNAATSTPPKQPEPVPVQTTEERAATWSELENFLKANFLNPDIMAAKIFYAGIASHRITDRAPSWMMLIAPPGSMKTELLKSLEGLGGVHFIDEVTASTFISGQLDEPGGRKRSAPASLLHRIGQDGIIIIPDFSTILTLRDDARAKILSQMRRIFDGQLRREFGTAENLEEREWNGRLTVVVGVTPEIDRYYSVMGALGDRFVQVRWSRAGGAEAALMAMDQNLSVSAELKKRARAFLFPILGQPKITAPDFPKEKMTRLAHFSEFIVHARAHVPRSYAGKEIDGVPQIESNTRLPQELVQIGRGWAALMGREQITEEDFELIVRAGWDTIPPMRRTILVGLAQGRKPFSLGLADSVVTRQLEDLEAIGLVRNEVKKTKDAFGDSHLDVSYFLSDKATDMLRSAGLLEALKK